MEEQVQDIILGPRPGDGSDGNEPVGKSLVGLTLDGRYQVESVIGQGGMSTVYKARHLYLNKDVAVKLMQEHLANNEGRLRFQREGEAAAALSHPNIIKITEFGVSEDGEPYMVMDYIDGLSLADLIRDNGRADAELCITIFKQATSALEHAHKVGILHRDLKPSNVMLVTEPDKSVNIRVVDFGLARFLPGRGKDQNRLTAAGELVGSPYYMSPEQIRDEELDARSDVYALGCLMYETLTGCRPFSDTNAITVLSMHLYEEPPPFSLVLRPNRIPSDVEFIVRKCLAKNPNKRYQTMAQIANDLKSVRIWTDGPAKSVPINLSHGAPYTAPKVRINENGKAANSVDSMRASKPGANAESARKFSGAESQNSAFVDSNMQYTLQMQKPEFPRDGLLDRVRRAAAPLVKFASIQHRRLLDSFEGKGQIARRQRIAGTRVLIAVLGDSDDLVASAETDAQKYAVYYKSIEKKKWLSAQDFIVLLSTEKYDIIHLLGTFDRRGIFNDSTGFALRLTDVKRACDYAQVKFLWVASSNRIHWLKDNPALDIPTFHMLFTGDRGSNFPKFLSSILSRLSRGDSVTNACSQVTGVMQFHGEKMDIKLVAGLSDISFLP